MGLVGVLVSGLRMLLRSIGMLFTLGMIALAMMVGSGAVSLGRILVVLSGFVVFVFSHFRLVGCLLPAGVKSLTSIWFRHAPRLDDKIFLGALKY
jgi:hypothetical protein